MGIIHNTRLQHALGGTFLERWSVAAISELELFILGFHTDAKKLRLLKGIRRERRSMVTGIEQFFIHSLASGVRNLEGDFAEVGVYAGSTAKTICTAKGEKRFHICDTFTGLPQPTAEDRGAEEEGRFSWGLESIRAYLHAYPNLEYHEGVCPHSIEGKLDDTRFCFVHLDVDLYSSTRQCLEYFFPRVVPGGVLISHDYSLLRGVRQAFTEFTADRAEQVIELPTTQCMLIKAG